VTNNNNRQAQAIVVILAAALGQSEMAAKMPLIDATKTVRVFYFIG
jgi:hypothetical protein